MQNRLQGDVDKVTERVLQAGTHKVSRQSDQRGSEDTGIGPAAGTTDRIEAAHAAFLQKPRLAQRSAVTCAQAARSAAQNRTTGGLVKLSVPMREPS